MCVVNWKRADVVECMDLKPCLSLAGERNSLTLAAGHSSEMDLYEVPYDEPLPVLGIGMTNEVFQIDGRRQDLSESL